jgi:hypothetical protein
MMKIFQIIKIAVALLAIPSVVNAATYCARPSAQGGGTGADWTNAIALSTVVASSSYRGDTIYISGESYGSITFSAGESGTSVITIKKATASDHVTDTGWNSTWGTDSAEFTYWDIETSYWEIDGQVGQLADTMYGVPAIPGYVEHGIKVLRTGSANSKCIRVGDFGDIQTDITFRHIEAGFLNTPGQQSEWYDSMDITYLLADNVVASYCWFHDAGRVNWFLPGSTDNSIFEYGVLERCSQADAAGASSQHAELSSIEGGDSHIFRYSYMRDWRSTGGLILHDDNGSAPHLTNYQVYGCVFTTTGYYTVGDANGVINNLSDGSQCSAKVYNNTFVDVDYGCMVLTLGLNWVYRYVYNNIFYNCQRSGGGDAAIGGTHDYNWYYNSGSQSETNIQNGSGDPFVNLSIFDLRLVSATNDGTDLSSPHNQDCIQTLGSCIDRGADGTWDRGAFEYGPSTAPSSSGVTFSGVTIGQ